VPLITGVGWVTVSGMGRGRERNDFAMTKGRLPRITRKSVFDRPHKHFGRMDEFSKLGLAAVAFALRDAGLYEWSEKRDIGIIASTVYGCLHTDIDYFDTVIPENGGLASPALFSYTLPNCPLGEAACHFGLTGACYVINEQQPSGIASLYTAIDGIEFNEFEKALAGICDTGCPSHISLEDKGIPGAAFVVIEKAPESSFAPYGSISLNEDGDIIFNGKRIENLVGLIQECLRASPG